MSVSLTHTQTRSVDTGVIQTVETITASTGGIPKEVFVFNTSDGTYSRIATLNDLNTYPVGQSAAQTASLDFYRALSATRVFASLTDAMDYAEDVHGTLQILCNDFNTAATQFTGSTTETVTSV